MRYRSVLFGAVALAGVAVAPRAASASTPPPACTTTFALGFGGSISGCWNQITVAALYKNAADVSNLYWFLSPPSVPPTAGTALPDITDGPSTPTATYLLQNGSGIRPFDPLGANNSSAQLVFRLFNTTKNYSLFSGNNAAWNGPGFGGAAPAGIQNILLQVNGQVFLGDNNGNNTNPFGTPGNVYLLGWEDLNGGCNLPTGSSATSVNWSSIAPTGGASLLNQSFVSGCTPSANGTDNDFNDFYILLSVQSQPGIPTDVVPEPVTMSMMAMGLIAMGGASLRRRKKK